jgi:hypothetical protein
MYAKMRTSHLYFVSFQSIYLEKFLYLEKFTWRNFISALGPQPKIALECSVSKSGGSVRRGSPQK